MIEIIYSPKWFYGRDLWMDIISVLVLLLISFFAIQYYRLGRNKNYLCLSLSFLFLSLSFIGKILMSFAIYNQIIDTRNYGFATITFEKLVSSDNLFFVGFLGYRLLTLFGLYILYSVYNRQTKGSIFLISYLIFALTLFTHTSYYMFQITALILLSLVTLHYFRNYYRTRLPASKFLAASFFVITISQVGFVFIKVDELFYPVSEIIQLIGYMLLLLTFIMVLRYGKKKNKD